MSSCEHRALALKYLDDCFKVLKAQPSKEAAEVVNLSIYAIAAAYREAGLITTEECEQRQQAAAIAAKDAREE